MSAIENPPAFPVIVPKLWHHVDTGMTMRDWFAGQVIGGGMAEPRYWRGEVDNGLQTTPVAVAERAYLIADAMLLARTTERKGTAE